MAVCECGCGETLTGRQIRWASHGCYDRHRSRTRVKPGPGRGRGRRITTTKLDEVKRRFPSCAQDWDVAMVEKAWPRLASLLTRRIERLNTQNEEGV